MPLSQPVTPPPPNFLRQHLQTLPIHRTIVRSIEARLFWELDAELEEPILDIGSGDGTFAQIAFPTHHGQIVGIDPRRDDTHEAHARGAYGLVMVADGAHIPCANNSFPTVVSNCVLEHVVPLDATLREIARVLKPGGRFITGVVNDRFASMLLGTKLFGPGYGRWFNKNAVHINTFSPEGWTERFQAAGLQVEDWHFYVSPGATKLLDFSHYYGVPSLLTRKLLGRWLVAPPFTPNLLWEPLLRPIYLAPPPSDGSCIFFKCRKPA